MIKTFKFEPKFSSTDDPSVIPASHFAVLGEIPAGRIVKCEPVFEGGKPLWLIEVDTAPSEAAFTEHYRR